MVERSKRIELRVTADELMKIHERMEEVGVIFAPVSPIQISGQ